MLGKLVAVQGERTVSRFRTYKTGVLLATLAYYGQREHAREELIERLWPECNSAQGRNSLSQSLSSLRHQLEPPGVPVGSVLEADRFHIRLNPEVTTTDVREFEEALRTAAREKDDTERMAKLETAAALYQGELLPGYYEDWNLTERERLKELYLKTLDALTRYWERSGQPKRALDYALRALSADPTREETHVLLIRLYAALGQNQATRRQYQALTALLQTYGAVPDAGTRALVAGLKTSERPLLEDVLVVSERAEEVLTPTPADAPLSVSLDISPPDAPPTPSGNLPLLLSRFFGRSEETERLAQRLHPAASSAVAARLVSVTGPGGIGKTRIAVETANRLRAAYQNSVWFIPLAATTEREGIFTAIAGAMKLFLSGKQEIGAEVFQALAQRPTLLLLDNFEQLLPVETSAADDSANAVRAMLEQLPTLRCLVTSRRRLGVAGEQELPLAPLPVPAATETLEQLASFDSVRLFVDRAQNVRPDFQITSGNAAVLAQLCRQLEGIPLAIELAASRSQALAPAQILQRLSNRLDFLADRRQQPEARHQTLRAAVEWSYQLLSPELQRFFAALSVFRGGCALEAAETVCTEALALDYLAMLRECSLIQTEEAENGEMRFRLLESLREYAAEHVAPEEAVLLRARHALWYLALAEEAKKHLSLSDLSLWRERLEADQDNLRAALDWWEAQSDTNSLRMGIALGWFWEAIGHIEEGRKRFQSILEKNLDAASLLRSNANNEAGLLAMRQGDYFAAERYLQSSHDLLKAEPDSALLRRVLGNLGNIAWYRGDYGGARDYYEQSLTLAREEGNRRGQAVALGQLGLVTKDLGDREAGGRMQEESLALFRQIGDTWQITVALCNLGTEYMAQNRISEARAVLEERLALSRQQQQRWHTALALDNLGALLCMLEEWTEARAHFLESLNIQQEMGDREGLVFSLEGLARIGSVIGDAQNVARLMGATEAMREALGAPLPSSEQQNQALLVHSLQQRCGEKEFARLRKQGRTLTQEQAVTLALSL
jgi:predicted ATPase/DNA-binding SARP family transcriptional activator